MSVQQNKIAKAKLSTLRISPIKLNFVADLIRGQHITKALVELKYCKKRISNDVRKLLLSAIANAENNHGMDIDSLVVKEVLVGKALLMKRFHARARGRGAKIEKFFSNITILLQERKG